MGQESICGLNVGEATCSRQIKAVPSVDFLVNLMDYMAELFESVEKPDIKTTLFEPYENAPLTVTIIPAGINDEPNHLKPNVGFIFVFRSSSTKLLDSFGEILLMYKLFVNFVEAASKHFGLTFTQNFVINNSREASATLTVSKTFDALTSVKSI